MRELFERLLTEGEAGIDRLVTDKVQESVTLDFKKKVDASNGKPDDQDKRVLAKAMSAFANSAGGLIVYGVHGVPGSDGVDCAQDARPIAEIERFISALHELTGELLQPRHSGIQVGMIRSDRTPGAGYAVVNVERSERRPHRAEAKNQQQYYKRGGSGSYVMQHYDIKDAFKRISSPDLMLSISNTGSIINGTQTLEFFALQIFNSSNTTAKFPYVHVGNLKNCHMNNSAPNAFPRTAQKGYYMFSGKSDDIINPQVMVVAGYVCVLTRSNVNYDPQPVAASEEISFEWQFGCENTRAKSGTFSFTLGGLPKGNLVVAM